MESTDGLAVFLAIILAFAGAFISTPIIYIACAWRKDRQEAKYWRQKWHYGSGSDPDVLVRAAVPEAPEETLLRAGQSGSEEEPKLLLRGNSHDGEYKR